MSANTPEAGVHRGVVAVKALDHDMCMKHKLVPGGILEPLSGRSFLFLGTNFKTSDFMADGLLLWWRHRGADLHGLKQLVINLDNGPECSGRRSQFLLRMSEFSAIERYWAGLEKSWNGDLLNTVETVVHRAGNFYWKGMRTIVSLVDGMYEKGIKISRSKKKGLEQRLLRSPALNWWDITISPKMVYL